MFRIEGVRQRVNGARWFAPSYSMLPIFGREIVSSDDPLLSGRAATAATSVIPPMLKLQHVRLWFYPCGEVIDARADGAGCRRTHDRPRICISRAREDLGLYVIEAADLEDARNALHTRSDIQLVVIDVAVGKGDEHYAGVRLLASRWPHVSLIVTTGAAAPRPGELPPQVRLLPKPYSPPALIRTVREVLGELRQPIIVPRRYDVAPAP
jgi:CheY-like chemotaxis protein